MKYTAALHICLRVTINYRFDISLLSRVSKYFQFHQDKTISFKMLVW